MSACRRCRRRGRPACGRCFLDGGDRLDRSLVRIRVRDDAVYVGHGGTVLATDRDGFLHDGIEHGLFVDQTRLISRYRCLVDGESPLPVALSSVGQHSWLGYYLIAGREQRDRHADLTTPEGAAQEAVELRISRVV